LNDKDALCIECSMSLPDTGFFDVVDNPIERMFYGRVNVHCAGAAFYYTKESLLQQLLVQLKYKKNPAVGRYLGRHIGLMLQNSNRFNDVDVLVPLPLNEKKEAIRGYNQAAVICEGIAEVWNIPIEKNAVKRNLFTESQTQKGRTSRWQNMEGVFALNDASLIEGKHVLLVDDVVTTGATLEVCGSVITSVPQTRLSMATVAWTI